MLSSKNRKERTTKDAARLNLETKTIFHLEITKMSIRFVTQKIHALIDYPVAITLIAMPFILGLGSSNPIAFWLSFVTGIAALLLTILTDHETGVIKVLPYSLHLSVDFLVGLTFAVAPFALGFAGLDAVYYWANAAAVLTVVSLHSPQELPKLEATPNYA